MLAPGSDAGFDQLGFCAPVTGRVKYFTFYAITEIPVSKLKVEINWGEGKKRYDVTSQGYDSNLEMYVYNMPEATHVYGENRKNPKCSYPVTVQAVVDGKLCGAPKQSGTVIVWDKDDATGGGLLLDPVTYYACPGTEFSVNFTDESTWNCVPPKEKINVNWPKRTTQFVYGTTNTITGSVKIEDVPATAFPFEGAFQEYEDKKTGPGGEFSKSAKITIPATAKVGEKFEITLNNWNYCNQRPEAPIQRKAIIEIVAKPEAAFTITNKDDKEADAFCPGEEVNLNGGYTTEAGGVLATDVQFNWTIENIKTGEIKNFANQKNVVLEKGFSQPGNQKITLKVINKKTNASVCEDILEKTISIIDAPAVQSSINNVAIKELFLCAEDLNNVYYEIAYKHTITSNEAFTYGYNLFKRNSTKTTPDSTLNLTHGVGLKLQDNKAFYNAIYTKQGLYRVQIVARNNSTGCVTVEENKVAIYEKPVPNFTVEGFCEGQATFFTDKSSVSASVPGDKLTSWAWDLNYTEENKSNNSFDSDGTGKTFKWTFSQPGIYNIALKVSSKAGCDTIKTTTVEIKAVPEPKLISNYAGHPICQGDTVRFENKSIEITDTQLFPNGVAYTLFVSDSIAIKEIVLKEGQKFVDYSTFYNPSDSVETYTVWLQAKGNHPNNCTVNSDPVLIKVRSGAAAGYNTLPAYSPFEPNCSPKTLKFITNAATQAIQADSYKWTIIFNGEIKDEIIRKRGDESFETLEYIFGNNSSKYLDYEVKLTVEKAGICVVPSINTFRIYPNPRPQFTAVPVLEACDSTVFELKVTDPAGISDYIWEFFPALPSNNTEIGVKDDNYFIAYNRPSYGQGPVSYTVKLRAKNFYGCEEEWMEEVTINPVVMHDPVLKLINTEGNGCRPLKANFINETIGDPAKITYDFFVENVETGALTKIDLNDIEGDLHSTFSYSFYESGNFKAYIQGSAALEDGTCTRALTNPVEISIKNDPVANFTVFPTEDCGSLTAVIAKTNFDSKFNTWSITDDQSGEFIYGPVKSKASEDTFNQYVFENTSKETKTFTIKLTAENASGCMASDTMMVTVFPQPKAYFNITADVCDPYVVTVDHNLADNRSDVSYTWIWGDGTTSEGINPPAHSYRNDSYTRELHYNIKLIAESANGCTSDSTVRLVVHPKVNADFEANVLTGCAPLNVNFTNKSRGAIDTYSGWYIRKKGSPTFSFIDNTLLQHTFENEGTVPAYFEVMYIAKNAGGCADSVVREITVQPEVVADFSIEPSKEVYSGTNIKFVNQKIIPGITYAWNWGDGSVPQITNNGVVNHSYINTTTNNHYYEVSLTADDPVNGCKSTRTTIVTVYPKLQLTLSSKKDTICIPEIPEFNLVAHNVKNHYWYAGRKGKIDFTRKLNDIYDPALFPNETSAPITYEVVYVGVTSEGFKDSTGAEVVVYPALKPSFILDGLTKQLPNATFNITNTTPNASGWVTTWDFGNGETSGKANPGSYQYPTFGTYNITLTISNGFCSEATTKRITVTDALPEISFNMEQIEGCWPVTVKFQNTSEFTDEDNYFWDFGDGMGTSTAINPTYTYNKPGNYKVTLNALNRTGEENATFTAEQIIKVYPQPSPDFVVRKELVYIPEEPVHVANYSQRGVWYKWDFGDGTIYEGADQFEPVHYYKKPGEYNIKLVVRSEFGCEDSITVLRAVTAEGGGNVTIPNAFTPNPAGGNGGHIDQGGINDVFHPVFKGTVVKYQLLIYNRWGELVFETKNTNIGWDGYYKDRLCNSGMYLYKLTATLSDGKNINEIGDIMLIQ